MTARTRVLSVRFTREELAILTKRARQLNLNRSEFLRRAALLQRRAESSRPTCSYAAQPRCLNDAQFVEVGRAQWPLCEFHTAARFHPPGIQPFVPLNEVHR